MTPTAAREVAPSARHPEGLYRRLARKPLALACIIYLAAIIAVAILAPVLLPHVADQNTGSLREARQGPSGSHLLGTDAFGRDVLERLLVGTRVTLLGVAEAVAVVLVLGVPLGVLAGYFGGVVDRVVSWVMDIMFAMPGIVIILVVLAVFPQSLAAAMVTFGVLTTPSLARVVRSATLPLRRELYVDAARVAGLPGRFIMTHHILPRIAGPIVVQASLLAAMALVIQSSLSFLGLIVRIPRPSWGGMVGEGAREILQHPWLIWPPGVAIFLTVLAFGLLGDAIRDASTERWGAGQQAVSRRAKLSRQESAARGPQTSALLSVEQLDVWLATGQVLKSLSFEIQRGETLGIVGESGCGKSMTAKAVLGILPRGAAVTAGHIWFGGRDLAGASPRELSRVRGSGIALVSQEPMVSLDPAFRIGTQLAEALRTHRRLSRRQSRAVALDLLADVQIPDPAGVARLYPHQVSGGMAQRISIARALAGEPALLIADEPTTALDVTIQAEILDLLRDLGERRGMAILLVTHDWGVVSDICDRAIVMYAGEVVEQSTVANLYQQPSHPYTRALLDAHPENATKDRDLAVIPGTVPRPGQWPRGCHFAARCPLAVEACRGKDIPMLPVGERHGARCIRVGELVTGGSRGA